MGSKLSSKDSRLVWSEDGVYYLPLCPTCGSEIDARLDGRPNRYVLAAALIYEGKDSLGEEKFRAELEVFDTLLMDVMVDAANAHLAQRAPAEGGR